MNNFERLEQDAYEKNIGVDIVQFRSKRIKGLYCNGNIAINKSLKTTTERYCVLSEELGHYDTSVGDIITLDTREKCKQEHQARFYAYNSLIGLHGLIDAFEHGCHGRTEIAEFLEVTEEYLADAIDCYRNKYGVYTIFDNYIIYFIPNLAVGKIF